MSYLKTIDLPVMSEREFLNYDSPFQYYPIDGYVWWSEWHESGQEDTAEIANWREVNAPKDPRSYKSTRKEKVNTAEVRLLAKKEEAQADWFKKFMK